MQAGRVPGQCNILVAGPAGNVLFPALLYESGLKPSLATTTAKVSERVVADPPGWERDGGYRDMFGGLLALVVLSVSSNVYPEMSWYS